MCLTCGHTKGQHTHMDGRVTYCGKLHCYCPRYIKRRWWNF